MDINSVLDDSDFQFFPFLGISCDFQLLLFSRLRLIPKIVKIENLVYQILSIVHLHL